MSVSESSHCGCSNEPLDGSCVMQTKQLFNRWSKGSHLPVVSCADIACLHDNSHTVCPGGYPIVCEDAVYFAQTAMYAQHGVSGDPSGVSNSNTDCATNCVGS